MNRLAIAVAITLLAGLPSIAQAASACPVALDAKARRLLGAEENLCQYAGKVVLVVNTASQCGFTRQYEGLEALYKKYQDRGFVVLGFPSADFGGQEFDDAAKTAEFCKVKYGVTFPLYTRSSVSGPGANPVFKQLTAQTKEAPAWNFHKYLIGRDGKAQAFASKVTPATLEAQVEKALTTP